MENGVLIILPAGIGQQLSLMTEEQKKIEIENHEIAFLLIAIEKILNKPEIISNEWKRGHFSFGDRIFSKNPSDDMSKLLTSLFNKVTEPAPFQAVQEKTQSNG